MVRRILLVTALLTGLLVAAPMQPARAGCTQAEARDVTGVDAPMATEGTDEFLIFTVTINAVPVAMCDATITYETSDGTATADTDYTPKADTVTITHGSGATTTTIAVPVIDDSVGESDETVNLTITKIEVTGGIAGTIADSAKPATGTIKDNDGGPTTTTSSTSTSTTTTTLPPDGELSDDNPAPGGETTVTARGFKGGSEGEIFILSTPIKLATANADANGVIKASVTIPTEVQPGAHTIEVRGVDSTDTPRTVSIPITIAGEVTETTQATRPLAATGSGLETLALVAGVLAAAGGALLIQARRRTAA